jgi:hypothetical protein
MGFADTIRLLASLIVLGCSIAGRIAENAFGNDKNRIANAISLRSALGLKTRAARRCYGMAKVGPAFHGGMPGEPIWSLHWRRHSASRRLPPWPARPRAIATASYVPPINFCAFGF